MGFGRAKVNRKFDGSRKTENGLLPIPTSDFRSDSDFNNLPVKVQLNTKNKVFNYGAVIFVPGRREE